MTIRTHTAAQNVKGVLLASAAHKAKWLTSKSVVVASVFSPSANNILQVFEQLPADGGGGGGRESGSGDADPGNPLSCCERSGNGSGGVRTFFIVVHVLSDHAFKKYMRHCSRSDAPLLRGMLLKARADAGLAAACAHPSRMPL
jgi:hypothetical protein